MPVLFEYDDYDRCLLYDENFLYCSLTFQLFPKNPSNTSTVWDVIKKVSLKQSNYRHDILRHGICVPETCPSVGNGKSLSNSMLKIAEELGSCYHKKYESLGLTGNVVKVYCENQHSPYKVDIYDISSSIFILAYIFFVLFASLYEGTARYRSTAEYNKMMQTSTGKFLSAFSIPKNFYRLKQINKIRNSDLVSLSCIQGIRFYNMICVILAHTIMVQFAAPTANPLYAETVTTYFFNSLVLNGGYVVQTFFLLSGWLLTYNVYNRFDGKKKLRLKHIIIIFLHRYVRLTPTLAFVVAINSTWMIHISRGPFWDKIVGEEYTNCRKNWWINLLYINNYVRKEQMCLQNTWYLATDTQLFTLSLVILFLMKRYERFSKYILAFMLILGIIIPATISYINNFDILIRQFPEPLYNFCLSVPQWHIMYSASYSNITGYIIGIIFGYISSITRKRKLNISKLHVILWWLLSFGLPLSVVLAAGKMYQEDYTYTKLESALYWGFGKGIFALGLAIAIFGMTRNTGWFVLWFCRWPPAQVLGRLTFSAYLIHVALIKVRIGSNRYPLFASNFSLFHACLGDVVLAYLVATLMTLFIEMPISSLQKFSAKKYN